MNVRNFCDLWVTNCFASEQWSAVPRVELGWDFKKLSLASNRNKHEPLLRHHCHVNSLHSEKQWEWIESLNRSDSTSFRLPRHFIGRLAFLIRKRITCNLIYSLTVSSCGVRLKVLHSLKNMYLSVRYISSHCYLLESSSEDSYRPNPEYRLIFSACCRSVV